MEIKFNENKDGDFQCTLKGKMVLNLTMKKNHDFSSA